MTIYTYPAIQLLDYKPADISGLFSWWMFLGGQVQVFYGCLQLEGLNHMSNAVSLLHFPRWIKC